MNPIAKDQKEFEEAQQNMPDADRRNAATINRWLPTWFRNLRKNCGIIDEDFSKHGNRNAQHAVPKWFRTEGNGCALVLGSGPSLNNLERNPSLLRDWRGLIICGSSNATIPAGITKGERYPDLAVAVDDFGPSAEPILLHGLAIGINRINYLHYLHYLLNGANHFEFLLVDLLGNLLHC